MLYAPPRRMTPMLIYHAGCGSLNIPANNCDILQRGEDLELVDSEAGEHCITIPNVTYLRGISTMGNAQTEMPTKEVIHP